MPRTEEQKQRRKQYIKEWRLKNKEKIIQNSKEYYQKNKEKINEYNKKYHQDNKEKIKIKLKEYNQTLNCKRIKIISRWKKFGLVSTDYNLLYDNYLKSTNCEECGIEYGKFGDGTATHRCLDHDHETGLFRNYLCHGCNLRRR